MSLKRRFTPNKALVLATVAAHPGLSSDEIAAISGVSMALTRHILEELFASKLVYSLKNAPRVAKLWYIRQQFGNSESIEFRSLKLMQK